jgi:hypothetical protein
VTREILPGSLRAIANYVQGVSNHDLVTLRSSGSKATDNGKAQSSLDKPGIQMIDSQVSKQLVEVAILLF